MIPGQRDLDVLIVGAGLAGMSAYKEAKQYGALNVALVEYEKDVGGELRFYPTFEDAIELRVEFLTSHLQNSDVHIRTTAVGILPAVRPGTPLEVSVSSEQGTHTIRTQVLLICTGMMDLARESHAIPGNRPAGIYAPSFAAQVLDEGYLPGLDVVLYVDSRRDVELGRRLLAGGARLVTILTNERLQSQFTLKMQALQSTVVSMNAIKNITGKSRLECISVEDTNGSIHEIQCDTFIYASGRESCLFALKASDVQRSDFGGIKVDALGRTSIPGVFAAGSCVSLDKDHAGSIDDGRRVMQNVIQTLSTPSEIE